MDEEALHFHAVASALHGDRRLLSNLATHDSWKHAYQVLLMGTAPVPTLEAAEARLARNCIEVFLKKNPLYPPLLREIPDAPHLSLIHI